MELKTCLEKRVTFCGQNDEAIAQRGRLAELKVIEYLCQNLPTRTGDFRILANYNLPAPDGAPTGVLELDVVVIARQGVFVLEVKDWHGIIEAYDGEWLQSRVHSRGDVIDSSERKARVFQKQWFGSDKKLKDLKSVACVSLIVLFQGKDNFVNHSQYSDQKVVDVSSDLLHAITEPDKPWNRSTGTLSDEQIERVYQTVFQAHVPGQPRRVGPYRIIGELSPGHSFEAFEAVRTAPDRRARVKRYVFDHLTGITDIDRRRAQQSANANWDMGNHANIVQTLDFLPDPNRPNVFYEVTEFIQGSRLDEVMRRVTAPLTLYEQLQYVEPLCAALAYAHAQGIYHRNVNPEVVFVTQHSVVKLADFDFAKITSRDSIMPRQPVLEPSNHLLAWNAMTAPELRRNPSAASPASDMYSLGMLWYYLALLPQQKEYVSTQLDLQPAHIDELRLPDDACELLRWMVQPEINNRPQSAQMVLERLEALRKGNVSA